MTHGYLLFSKKQIKIFSHRHFQKLPKQIFQTLLRTDTRVIQKSFKETFSNPLTIECKHFENTNEQVSKSPWITMDRKGSNTFPFYKSTSRTEKHSHKEFCCAFVLSMLENIKDGGDSCLPQHFRETSLKNSQFYFHRSQNWRLYWG